MSWLLLKSSDMINLLFPPQKSSNDESVECPDLLFSHTCNFSLSAGDVSVSLFETDSALIGSTFTSCLDGSE